MNIVPKTPMPADTNTGARVRSLSSRAALFSRLIDLEQKNPHPDHIKISEFKRRRLRVKDEIRHILSSNREASAASYQPTTKRKDIKRA
jgi:hypothetical protein